MTTVTVLNQKGGVGKTSICFHLAGALAAEGRRVLLLDNDPQGSLTEILLGPARAARLDDARTMAAVHAGDATPEAVIEADTGLVGIHLIPGSEAATRYNYPVDDDAMAGNVGEFLQFLDGYDVVLIDCPSNLQACSYASLAASDWVIVPVVCEDLGVAGVKNVRRFWRRVQGGPNPSLRLMGLLPSMVVKRKSIHEAYEQHLRDEYGADVFAATIPVAAAYAETITAGRPITMAKPKTEAGRRMKSLAREFLDRAAAGSPALQGVA